MGRKSGKIDWLLILGMVFFLLIVAGNIFFLWVLVDENSRGGEPWGALPLLFIGPGLIAGLAGGIGLALFRRRGAKPKPRAYFGIAILAFFLYLFVGRILTDFIASQFWLVLTGDLAWLEKAAGPVAIATGLVAALFGRLCTEPKSKGD